MHLKGKKLQPERHFNINVKLYNKILSGLVWMTRHVGLLSLWLMILHYPQSLCLPADITESSKLA